MQLDKAVQEFIAAKIAAGRSPRTVEWYRQMLAIFQRWLHDADITGADWFRPSTIEAYYLHERQRGVSESTIAGHHRAIHAFLRWLQKRRYIARDVDLPTSLIEPPKPPLRPQNRVTLKEYAALLDSIPKAEWINHRDRLMVATLFLTGVRRIEMCRLEIKDFDFEESLLVVRAGKGGGWRDVPLLPAVRNEFAAYMLVRPAWESNKVFLSADTSGRACGELTGSGVHQRLKLLCKRAGMRMLNPHAFRHGLAIHLLNNTPADMSLIQRVLGHTKITTTAEMYARWDVAGIKQQYAAMMGVDGE